MELADGAIENRIEDNRVSDNGGGGLSLAGAHGNRVERNSVLRNARRPTSGPATGGIVLVEGSKNEFAGNRVVENGGLGGIVLDAAWDNRFAFNDVLRNAGSGIYFTSSLIGGIVDTNRLNGNREDGIRVSGGAEIVGVAVRNNVADRNGDDGIDVDSALTSLASNTARRNSDLGIEAVAGTQDGGGNRAFGNGNPLQCLNVTCSRRPW